MSFLFSLVRKFGMKLFSLIRGYFFVSCAIVIILSSMIWFIGPRLSFSGYAPLAPVINRLITIMVIIVLWGINNLIRQYRKNKKTSTVAEETDEPKKDIIGEQVALFTESFHRAMKTISDNWLGNSYQRRTHYALPWYVVMGLPNSGKTSFIAESDLKFPLAHFFGQENYKKIEPTNDVDYWVTDDAVLFDLAGKIVTHSKTHASEHVIDVNASIWHSFLELLKKYRPRRPINGVVLCIDVLDLIQSNEEERANKASLIHARLVELSETLGTRYTVHIVLTKLDLVDGFQSFFSGIPASMRNEPFGFTFELYNLENSDVWFDYFTKAYAEFIDRMNNQLIDRMAAMRNTESRQKVFMFARQFAGMSDILGSFFKDALHQDKFSTAPLVRGLFFASTRQEGVPFNAVLATTSSAYEMNMPILPAHSSYTRPHFATELLKGVIFKEAGLAGDNIRVERRKQVVQKGCILAACLTALIFGFFYHQAYQDNIKRSNDVYAAIEKYDKVKQVEQENLSVGAEYSKPLSAILEAENVFGDYKSVSSIKSGLTLYQGKKIGPEVDRAYYEILKTKFIPSLADYTKNKINLLGKNYTTVDSDERLEALRVYLMLGQLDKRETLDALGENKSVVEKWFGEIWQKQNEGNEELQDQLFQHLHYALYDAQITANLDPILVANTQRDLRRIPRDVRLYRNIKNLAYRQLANKISLRQTIGTSFNNIFKPVISINNDDTGNQNLTNRELTENNRQDVIISPFFSSKEFYDFFLKQVDSLSVVAVEDAWVAGEREFVTYSPEDLKTFKDKVRQRYASEYIQTWSKALNSLEIDSFESIDHAVAILEDITGPNRPFERLIELVKKNTEIYKPKTIALDKEQAIDDKLPFGEAREQGLRIERAFSRLNQMIIAEKEGDKTYFEELQNSLLQVYEYMKEIKQAGARADEIALLKAKDRINLKGEDPIYLLRRIGADLPEPLNRFFDKIADECWKVILISVKAQLQKDWNEKVYSRFNLYFADRFPFKINAKEDVSLKDFQEFFGPNGIVENFYKENLILFINEETGEPRILDDRKIEVSRVFLEELKKSLDVKRYYFDTKGAVSLNYTIRPKSLSGRLNKVVLNVEGQIIPYSHGPRQPTNILWPNVLNGKSESSVTAFSSKSRPLTKRFTGPWSGFKLLSSGKIIRSDADYADIKVPVGRGSIVYTLRITKDENIFVTQPLIGLSLPSNL